MHTFLALILRAVSVFQKFFEGRAKSVLFARWSKSRNTLGDKLYAYYYI